MWQRCILFLYGFSAIRGLLSFFDLLVYCLLPTVFDDCYSAVVTQPMAKKWKSVTIGENGYRPSSATKIASLANFCGTVALYFSRKDIGGKFKR